MRFIDYFDINDTTHLRAYLHLCECGIWPETFFSKALEGGVDMSQCMIDVQGIQGSMAKLYAHNAIREKGGDSLCAPGQ